MTKTKPAIKITKSFFIANVLPLRRYDQLLLPLC
jgi:hypothetical protein